MGFARVTRDEEKENNFAIFKKENFLNLAMNCLSK